jgi:4-hydroxyproline epimerase
VTILVDGLGPITGDVAWGGNWFFLVNKHGQDLALSNVERLTAVTWAIRQSLERDGVTGAERGLIDHIELFGPPSDPNNHSRSFVLCPGKAYDRSPCGTGTSAKIACLIEDGKIQPGEVWRQESVIGSLFEASARLEGDNIIPRIRGTAYVTAEATLLLNPDDPFQMGIGS